MRTHGAKQQRDAVKRTSAKQLKPVFEVCVSSILTLTSKLVDTSAFMLCKTSTYFFDIRPLIRLGTQNGG